MRITDLRHVFLAAALVSGSAAGCAATPSTVAPPVTPRTAVAASPAAPAATRTRTHVDARTRADYFAAIRGDATAAARATKACDDAIAKSPDDAEPLVWRGALRLYAAGTAFRAGDLATGDAEWRRALAEMDRAVALAPDDVGIHAIRGAVLLTTASVVKDEARSRPLVERGVADYEAAMRLQATTFASLSLHAREELLVGLGWGKTRLGQPAEARPFFERLLAEAPESTLAPYARASLAGTPPAERPACNGCHGG